MLKANADVRRMLIVSNRLPFTISEEDSRLTLKESGGGLVSGLSSYLDSLKTSSGKSKYIWVGWPGMSVESYEAKEQLKSIASADFSAHPVFLSEEDMENFYLGFCNKTIWPLFHYFPSYARYSNEYWEQYKKVNEIFCEALMEIIKPDDVVWVHDYHLMLLPRMIRDKMPDVPVGFFLHIPFPSYEMFRLLPRKWGTNILEGLLGADLVGFHTHDYTQYFMRSVLRILGFDHNMGQIVAHDRVIKADTFPMGIDFNRFHNAALSPQVLQEASELRNAVQIGSRMRDEGVELLPHPTPSPYTEGVKVVLSIDRLDYAKGVINRLEGYEAFLEDNPDWHERVVLSLLITPSRIGVEDYQRTKQQLEEVVGRINGRFGNMKWTPVLYQYKSLPFEQLVALYVVSDVALITPLRDGMNLIAKEYIASRPDKTGVLVLSEMAGAAKELGEAILINPNSKEEIAEGLREALEMPVEEQKRRNGTMQNRLRRYDVVPWAEDFIQQLKNVKETQARFDTKRLSSSVREQMRADYERARRRLIFLDYDGTLIKFVKDPQQAYPPTEVTDLLGRLASDRKNEVVIISGRDKETLQRWFGDLRIGLVAEHGVWIMPQGEGWRMIKPISNDWKPRILPILETFTDRLPGSFVEEKEFSYAWHYRAADPEQGPLRAKELLDHLVDFTANIDVQVLQGSKVIEVKSAGVNKGTAGMFWLSKDEGSKTEDSKHQVSTFVLAIGDDWTDEHLFMVLPESAYSLRVGITQSYARFNLRQQGEVISLLDELSRHSSAFSHEASSMGVSL